MKTKLLLSLFATTALTVSLVHAADKPELTKKPCCSTTASALPEAAKELSDASLYQVESTWTNDAGKAVVLSELRGKPQLITMFFSSCEYACPILVNDALRIESALPEALRGKIGVTLVSFDTERDTPAALRKFRSDRSVPPHWNLFTGKSDDVLELAALLGVKYRKDARGQFAHSNVIFLLNAEGEIVHQQIGLNQPVGATVEAIHKLMAPGKDLRTTTASAK